MSGCGRMPYRPKREYHRAIPAGRLQEIIEQENKYFDDQGITQEIVETVLPTGGKGFQWAFYRHGVRIPNGINGL